MLKEQIRAQILNATKIQDETTKSVLKVVLGEINAQEAGGLVTEEQVVKIIRKVLLGIEEMLQYKIGDTRLAAEKGILEALLPKYLNEEEILKILSANEANLSAIKAIRSDGQATGIAMKVIKESKLLVDGNIVAKVIKQIRHPII